MFLFVVTDSSWRSPLYDGPYKVIACSSTFLRLTVVECEDSVTVACHKPLFAPGSVEPAVRDVVAALLVSSLKLHLLLLAVDVAAGRRIHHLLLLLPAFVVVDLLVSTLLSPTGMVGGWGGG